MRQISEIIVHCTATRPEWWASKPTSEKVREVRRWHVDGRGWSDIGYHYLIDRDGTIAEGRSLERDGAHVRGRNRGTIGISLFGGHGSSERDAFGDNFTPAQEASLRALIGELRSHFGDIPVSGHNQFAAKACPGFHVPTWFNNRPVKPVAFMPKEVQEVIDDADKPAAKSTSVMAQMGTLATGGIAVFGDLDWKVQMALSAVAGALVVYLLMERRRKAALGRRARKVLEGF